MKKGCASSGRNWAWSASIEQNWGASALNEQRRRFQLHQTGRRVVECIELAERGFSASSKRKECSSALSEWRGITCFGQKKRRGVALFVWGGGAFDGRSGEGGRVRWTKRKRGRYNLALLGLEEITALLRCTGRLRHWHD